MSPERPQFYIPLVYIATMYLIFLLSHIDVLHMCFDKFLFWVESRDLSQADNSIIRVSSFPSWVMGSRTFFSVSTTEPWTFCKMNALNPLKVTSHKKNWENWGKKLKLIKTSTISKCQIVYFCKIVKKNHSIHSKKEDTLVLLLSAWDRSRDSTQKRNL